MADNTVDKLIQRSIEKSLINHEKDPTMTFVNNHVVEKHILVMYYCCLMVMENNNSQMPKFDRLNK